MKRKLDLKSFGLGIATAAILGTTVIPAGAALVAKTIQVHTGVTLYIDDEKFTPKDPNGNVVQPFIYNGTTYLPVRAIGEAYDKAVQWDGKTSSVYIGKHANSAGTLLNSLSYLNASSTVDVVRIADRTDNLGKSHPDSYLLHDSMDYSAWATYLLNGQYDRFSGEFFLLQSKKSTTKTETLKIYGDGKLLYTAKLTAGVTPIDFDVDIRGVLQLKVEMTTTASSHNAFPDHLGAIAQPMLY